jgi:hypothetical protein
MGAKSATAQAIAKSWAYMQDVSKSSDEEGSYHDEHMIKFADHTTQIYRIVETSISIDGKTGAATDTQEIYMGVGDAKNPLGPDSSGNRLRWTKLAWKQQLGWTDEIPPQDSFVFKKTITLRPEKLVVLEGHTAPDDKGPDQGWLRFLDRQEVAAPGPRGILTGFGLNRPTDDTINYKFNYVQPASADRYLDHKYTDWTLEGEGANEIVWLDRQKVMARDGEFLVSFKMLRSNGYICYRYSTRSCPHGYTLEGATDPTPLGDGTIWLDRQYITVPEGCGLRGFEFYRPSEHEIAYRYWYAKFNQESDRESAAMKSVSSKL